MKQKRIRRSSKFNKISIAKIATNRQSLASIKRKSKLGLLRPPKLQKKQVREINLLLWDQSLIFSKENVMLANHPSYRAIEIRLALSKLQSRVIPKLQSQLRW
jgi:hypothetical protein